MNVIKFEIKKRRIAALIWTAALLGLFWVYIIGAYPYYTDSTADISKVLEGFPAGFAEFFGIDLKVLFSFGGFYNFTFTYVGLIGAIMAAYFGISIFAEERRSGCEDFLMTRPAGRGRIYKYKFCSGLLILFIVNALYIILNIAASFHYGDETSVSTGRLCIAALSLGCTQLVFYAAGALYGVFARKVRSPGGAATMIGAAAFVLTAVINMLDKSSLLVFAPLKYFEPYRIFGGELYKPELAAAAAAVFAMCCVISFLKYTRGDIRSV